MVRNSTEYYRKNRASKKIVYQCPHCEYSTPNTKIQLTNHINAKHTPENERPYQCRYCEKGFAQKAHLHLHLSREHDVHIPEKKLIAIAYIIKITAEKGKSKKTRARQEYYQRHAVIRTDHLNDRKHEYLPGVYMKQHDIHYDQRNGFIQLDKCSLWQKSSLSL